MLMLMGPMMCGCCVKQRRWYSGVQHSRLVSRSCGFESHLSLVFLSQRYIVMKAYNFDTSQLRLEEIELNHFNGLFSFVLDRKAIDIPYLCVMGFLITFVT